jgi:hypothetical protein
VPNGAWKTGWRRVGRTRWDRILADDAIDLSSRFGMAAFLAIAGQTGRVACSVPFNSSSVSPPIHARNSAMTFWTLRADKLARPQVRIRCTDPVWKRAGW